MGNMTVEQIYRDRQTFSTKVFEVDIYDYLIITKCNFQVASVDLHALGIQVISYTIKVDLLVTFISERFRDFLVTI